MEKTKIVLRTSGGQVIGVYSSNIIPRRDEVLSTAQGPYRVSRVVHQIEPDEGLTEVRLICELA